MGVRPTFSMGGVRKMLDLKLESINAAIVQLLSYLGELCVNHARSLNTYRDQTGNLRSSIGYVIVKDGIVVKRSFSGGTSEGKRIGLSLARQLAADINGWGLIVVAGMNYALAVESRGLDVLTSAEQLAKSELPGLIRQLSSNVNRMAA